MNRLTLTSYDSTIVYYRMEREGSVEHEYTGGAGSDYLSGTVLYISR